MQDWIKENSEETEQRDYVPAHAAAHRQPVRHDAAGKHISRQVNKQLRLLLCLMAALALLLGIRIWQTVGNPVSRLMAYGFMHGMDVKEYPERLLALMKEDDTIADAVLEYTEGKGKKRDINPDDYPEDLLDLLERNHETAKFVVEYPVEKDAEHTIALEPENDVPLYLQWDQRWGYEDYGGNLIALNGCGPTCLSMALVYLTGDTSYNPLWVCNWSEEHGYYVSGAGTAWTLFGEGAAELGLTVWEISPKADQVEEVFEKNGLVACVMGPGDFTSDGHFILITDYRDGIVSVRDPNSVLRSEQTWNFEEIKDQILCLWSIYAE